MEDCTYNRWVYLSSCSSWFCYILLLVQKKHRSTVHWRKW